MIELVKENLILFLNLDTQLISYGSPIMGSFLILD